MTLDDARRYLGIRTQVFTDQPDAARPILEWLIAEVERLQASESRMKTEVTNRTRADDISDNEIEAWDNEQEE